MTEDIDYERERLILARAIGHRLVQRLRQSARGEVRLTLPVLRMVASLAAEDVLRVIDDSDAEGKGLIQVLEQWFELEEMMVTR